MRKYQKSAATPENDSLVPTLGKKTIFTKCAVHKIFFLCWKPKYFFLRSFQQNLKDIQEKNCLCFLIVMKRACSATELHKIGIHRDKTIEVKFYSQSKTIGLEGKQTFSCVAFIVKQRFSIVRSNSKPSILFHVWRLLTSYSHVSYFRINNPYFWFSQFLRLTEYIQNKDEGSRNT